MGDANRDHECWERPEDMSTPRTLYKITNTSPGSEVAADAAAALAAASIVFKQADPNYSANLLFNSKQAYIYIYIHTRTIHGVAKSCDIMYKLNDYYV